MTDERPLVSVVIPVRREAAYIERSLGAVLDQRYPRQRLEVLVVDGMSDDGTRELVEAVAERHGWPVATGPDEQRGAVRLLDNPSTLTPAALNIGIRAATGAYVVRVDGHCELSPDYVERCIRLLEDHGHDCVGGAWETVGESPIARVIAAAQSSPFGVGNVAFRTGRDTAGPVDTVPFGAWPRSVFDRVGLFDEELVRNQDDELAFRIVQAGGTIWYDPDIRSRYYSRSDLRRLGRQYFQYGLYKIRVAQKRGGLATGRQVVPAAFVLALAGGAAASLVTRRARWVAAVAVPYAAANAVTSARLGRRHQVPAADLSAAFATLHLSYGTGYLWGIWRWRRHLRPPADGNG